MRELVIVIPCSGLIISILKELKNLTGKCHSHVMGDNSGTPERRQSVSPHIESEDLQFIFYLFPPHHSILLQETSRAGFLAPTPDKAPLTGGNEIFPSAESFTEYLIPGRFPGMTATPGKTR